MVKFLIEPNKIFDVNDRFFGPFVFDDSPEVDEVEEDEEA